MSCVGIRGLLALIASAWWLGAPALHAQDNAAPTAIDSPLADDPDDSTAPAPARSAPANLKLQLRQVEDERAHSSNLLPWLTVSVGAGAVVVSALAGVIHVLGCERGCATPNWVALTVVAAGAVATLGAIWLIRTDQDLHALDSRRYQLRQELDQYEHAALPRDRESARGSSAFHLRLAF